MTSLALVQQQAAAEQQLLPLLQALQVALVQDRGPPERLMQALSLMATQQALEPAREAVSSTVAALIRAPVSAAVTQAVALQIASSKGQLLAARAAEVLVGRSLAFTSPYARLAAQVLIWDAFREGGKEGAVLGSAQFKTFTRVRPAKEPRAHSRLEGVTLPIDQPYIIAGIAVDGPGDPRLPWSERAFCGHVLTYSRG